MHDVAFYNVVLHMVVLHMVMNKTLVLKNERTRVANKDRSAENQALLTVLLVLENILPYSREPA